MTLPIPEAELSQLREVRRGEWGLSAVIDWLTELEAELVAVGAENSLHPEPDWAWIDDWLHRSHLAYEADRG